jgi:hypothetical protein
VVAVLPGVVLLLLHRRRVHVAVAVRAGRPRGHALFLSGFS